MRGQQRVQQGQRKTWRLSSTREEGEEGCTIHKQEKEKDKRMAEEEF
jgi:hypothetical protein